MEDSRSSIVRHTNNAVCRIILLIVIFRGLYQIRHFYIGCQYVAVFDETEHLTEPEHALALDVILMRLWCLQIGSQK